MLKGADHMTATETANSPSRKTTRPKPRSVVGEVGGRKPGRTSAKLSYVQFFRASPIERIGIIKHGLLASEAKQILGDLTVTQAVAMRALNIAPATMNRKAKGEDRLPPAESERVLGVARLVGQVQAIVEESGNPQGFDAAAWTSRWLSEPVAALGGVRPLDLMDTMEGQNLVSNTLAQVQSGAYA
jgi:putative toxin-antitoxin system antitoxin component (TIGR02293 family)